MKNVWRSGVLALVLVLGTACTEQNIAGSELVQTRSADTVRSKWKLPARLREISGLALTPDGRLLAVDDEQAIIYQIDYDTGKLVKVFAIGEPVLRGDFEGIAYLQESVFLVTSNGNLFKVREGANGERVAHEKIKTGLGKQCEVEGLAQDPVRGILLLVCKNMRKKARYSTLSVFKWEPGDRQIDLDDRIELPMEEILEHLELQDFNPSGIAVDPSTGYILIVAARQHSVVSIDRGGNFVGAMVLAPAKWHRQAEGVEATPGAQLIIADEGGHGRARLTVYDKFHTQMYDNYE